MQVLLGRLVTDGNVNVGRVALVRVHLQILSGSSAYPVGFYLFLLVLSPSLPLP